MFRTLAGLEPVVLLHIETKGLMEPNHVVLELLGSLFQLLFERPHPILEFPVDFLKNYFFPCLPGQTYDELHVRLNIGRGSSDLRGDLEEIGEIIEEALVEDAHQRGEDTSISS